MGDYSITKVIIKIKDEYKESFQKFIEIEMDLDYYEDNSYHKAFWDSVNVTSFYYEHYVFGCGSYHAYTTSLGDSDVHMGSDFYTNQNYQTRFEDGLWFVEYSSKMKNHTEFTDWVLPIIADGWVGLYGDEYNSYPEKIQNNPELIKSSLPDTQAIIDNFMQEYNEEYTDKDDEDHFGYR